MPETGNPWAVDLGGETITAVFDPPAIDTRQQVVFACAHGAGGNMNDRGVLAASRALRARGIGIVRFNFPYTEKKSKRPDRMPRLKDTVSAVVSRIRAELRPATLIIGGRSMGGRAASMLAADGFDADGLLLLAYPLHPAGAPTELRDAHLPAITMPVLCFNGTRDTLCTPELMEATLKKVKPTWTMHWLEGADHSFHVLKSSGRSDDRVLDEIGEAAQRWVAQLGSS
jgi:predicted alpha/beta-hydrolase family hydrolase